MKTIDLIPDQKINILEVGCYAGITGKGLKEYCELIGKECFITGIDNNKDGEKLRFKYDKLIIGDADEMAYKIQDNSQHIIFIDSCHCFAHVISNFFSYAPKVKVGKYLAFHDTGKHIQPFKDFQHGDKENPDAYISTRKALDAIGLTDFLEVSDGDGWGGTHPDNFPGWELILDKADPENEAGGICVFKKLY